MTRRQTALPTWLCLVSLVVTAACGGGGGTTPATVASDPTEPPSTTSLAVVAADMQPMENGFAFANFPASWYEEQFDTDDLVALFGTDPSVCVDGVAEPCELTAEAAAFARMVNQARASGHCEGLVAVAQARFNETSTPVTGELPDDAETIDAIVRAFATQFVPEVRAEVERWLSASLAEKVSALEASLADGRLVYSLGVYTDGGGHAVLPYAVEFLTPTTPRIMVYDSNWPGRDRWVDVDLTTETWTFSFSGDDPTADPDLWTGGATEMDLTSIDTRAGTCPFCADKVGVAKNTLLVRSTDLDWSVDTHLGTVTPTDPGSDGDLVVTPLKTQSTDGRTHFDYLVQVPHAADGSAAKLTLPGTASVFVLNPGGIAEISTPGHPELHVEVGADHVASSDPNVALTLAVGNLVAKAAGHTARLTIDRDRIRAHVTTLAGELVETLVDRDAPMAELVAHRRGGARVLAKAADGVVQRRDLGLDGKVITALHDRDLNLNGVTWQGPAGLESRPIASLPSPELRSTEGANLRPRPTLPR